MNQPKADYSHNTPKRPALGERIVAVFDSLSPKQQQLAQYFLDHEATLAYLSANQVAEAVGVSAATVVRFARALGYDGYLDLQEHIRLTFSPHRTASTNLAERIERGEFNGDVLSRIAKVNTQNIEETLHQVALDTLVAAVDRLVNADRIRIFGGGLSGAAVVMMEHSFLMLGLPVRAIVNGGLFQTIELGTMNDRDVVLVISLWRYLRDTVDALHYAKDHGASTIALTDSPVSPVARSADYVFIAATERAAHNRSLTGVISLIDLINATIISRRPQESMMALKRIDDLYDQHGKLLKE